MFKNTIRRFIALAATLILILSISVVQVSAESTGYTTDSFNVDVVVRENHRCEITETINVNFHTAKHGIYRNIPFDMGKYKVTDISVEGDNYEVSTESSGNVTQKVIQIGDANETISGNKTYKISYVIAGYVDDDTSQDYFSLDVLPTAWDTAIASSRITIKMPKSLNWSDMKVYSGTYGQTNLASNVDYEYDEDDNRAVITGKNFPVGAGVTMECNLPEGYWVGAANNDWALIPLIVLMGLIPLITLLMWLRWGRDPKIVKTVEFYPPEDMTPAEIGYIIDDTVDTKDMVSLIMYFADKGYIQIDEVAKDKFQIKKLKDISSEEKLFAQTFFNGLFLGCDSVMMDELPANFGETVAVSKDQLMGHYKGKNRIFARASKICRGIACFLMMLPPVIAILLSAYTEIKYIYGLLAIPVFLMLASGLITVMVTFDKRDSVEGKKRIIAYIIGGILIIVAVGIAALITGLLTSKWWLAIVMVASMAITYILSLLMKARTKKAAEWQGKILGFKNFIKSAELEKLKALVEENPEYFYNVLPYAYVLGLSDKWAKKFENIPTKQPNWYYGGYGNPMFNIMMWNHMSRSCYHSMSAAMMPDISSMDTGGGGIGGGFGGGGFSGGGFGGGGGGSW